MVDGCGTLKMNLFCTSYILRRKSSASLLRYFATLCLTRTAGVVYVNIVT
jgi:hypothetical protein